MVLPVSPVVLPLRTKDSPKVHSQNPCPAESGARRCSQRSFFFLFLLRHRGAVTRWNHRSARRGKSSTCIRIRLAVFLPDSFLLTRSRGSSFQLRSRQAFINILNLVLKSETVTLKIIYCGYHLQPDSPHISAIDCSWATPNFFGQARVRPPGPPRALVSLSSKDGSTKKRQHL
jgi:hypothetical protein